ncbi:MAG: sigma factor-like helix-turn-helix DNA-binding protein [Clostridia bacterium]
MIIFRYYRDMTQGEVAKYFGLSQVQISRLEAKIIEKLKKAF